MNAQPPPSKLQLLAALGTRRLLVGLGCLAFQRQEVAAALSMLAKRRQCSCGAGAAVRQAALEHVLRAM